MNKDKNLLELIFQVSDFLKTQYFTNKKEIFFLSLTLSLLFIPQTYANTTPIKTASLLCEESVPILSTIESPLKNYRTNKLKTTNTAELLPIIKLGFEYKNTDDLLLHSQIAVSFQESNSFDYEKGYDSESFETNDTHIYWKFSDDHRKYVITGVQEISDDLEVPLEITMGYSGEVNLMLDQIQNVSREIYIKDKLTGNTYNLENGKINITLDKGVCTERFFLAFKESEALSVDRNTLMKETIIYADNKNQNVIISKNPEVTIYKVALYNILGKKTNFWEIKELKNSYQLAINNQIPTGIYIVRLNTDKGIINKKVLF
ncbi:T9SS type A sorting domain-containing protein [Polaribacter atrinae]|uniref:T9SS type A sorting domain-containing protein n=1 Tax=Polaribacter atrinae TaxID=1333662 RepID=UPI0030F759EE